MTLHAMFEAGNLFKAGFAGGPVTDWHFYDTIYTERYIGVPPKHEESYEESSPIKNAEKSKRQIADRSWNRRRQRALLKHALIDRS